MNTKSNAPAQTTPAPSNQVAQQDNKPKTFRDLINGDGYKRQLAAALPKGLSAPSVWFASS